MMFAAPAINPTAEYVHANLSFSSLIPNFNVTYFTSLSILVFAVGGCEKISPYVNKVENPSKGFPPRHDHAGRHGGHLRYSGHAGP